MNPFWQADAESGLNARNMKRNVSNKKEQNTLFSFSVNGKKHSVVVIQTATQQ